MKPVFIVQACRTAIGSFGGALVHTSPQELGTTTVRTLLARAGLEPSAATVDEVIFGNVLGAGHGMNIARQIAVHSGLSVATPAYTVNKVCGSGLKAVTLAATAIAAGDAETVLCGGVESMSQAAFASLSLRWGARMGTSEMKDLMISDGLTDAFAGSHMGITAENIAERMKISREAQDQYALQSQLRTHEALKAGHFRGEIAPVALMKRGKQVGVFEVDEYPRPDASEEALAALKPAFKKDGSVTAGNASGINDGAAALLLMSEDALKRCSITPLARVVGWASGGVSPEIMGLGPVEAVRRLLSKTSLRIEQFDAIEANEAFAVQALAVQQELHLDPVRVNAWGGAIALGHPIGASGARILVTLLSRLRSQRGKLGLATLCIGGGQGIALAVESLTP